MVQDRLGHVDRHAEAPHRGGKIAAEIVQDEVLDFAELVELCFVFSPRTERLICRGREEILGSARHEAQIIADEIRNDVFAAVLREVLGDRDEVGCDVRPLERTDFVAAQASVNADQDDIAKGVGEVGRGVVDAYELGIGQEAVALVGFAWCWKIRNRGYGDELSLHRPLEEGFYGAVCV